MFSKIIAFCLFLSVATAQEDTPAAVVVHPPTYSTALTSQTVRMTCAAYGIPKPTITWSRASGDLASKIADPDSGFSTYTKTVTVNGTAFAVAVLEICDVRVTDTDEYTCVADNGVTSTTPIASPEATFFLSVTGAASEPPAIVVRPPSEVSSVYVGSTVEAVCVAYGNPIPYISWSKENCDGLTCNVNTKVYDEVVTYGDISFRKSIIQLCNVSMANSGSYNCWAVNGVGGDGVAPKSVMWDLSVKPQPVSTSVSQIPPPTTTCPSYSIPSVAPRPTNSVANPSNTPTTERQVEELAVSENTYIGIIVVLAIVVVVLLIATIVAVIIAVKMRGSPQQKADIAHGQKHPQMIAVENPIHKEEGEQQLDEQEGDTMSYSDLAKKMEAEGGEDED